ncbi:unnamed protein product [Mesocestoides corti]|uniref:Secreted protein n=1 Tax=Mesocestoides corti TaxID=53468 RepID=A0A0R3UQF6_MESCO|nr:unnamed protein product [Mesocestoides corti]
MTATAAAAAATVAVATMTSSVKQFGPTLSLPSTASVSTFQPIVAFHHKRNNKTDEKNAEAATATSAAEHGTQHRLWTCFLMNPDLSWVLHCPCARSVHFPTAPNCVFFFFVVVVVVASPNFEELATS